MFGSSQVRWLSSNTIPPGMGGRNAPAGDDFAGAAGLVRKVLVVDDEEDLADLAEALLRSRGLEVVVANSAMDALRMLESEPDIDAVFSDIMMPGMNGLQLADAVSEFYPRIKIVLTSGFTVPAMMQDRARNYLFASKPYRLDTIMKLLRS